MAENIILCGYLGICSCFDCRKRQIPIWLLRLGVGAGMAYALFLLAAGRAGWQTVLAGAAPGTVMLLYSRLSQGKLGWADGLMVLPAGLVQHWERCAAEVFAACFLAFLSSVSASRFLRSSSGFSDCPAYCATKYAAFVLPDRASLI